jgi:hypothetical protein
MSMLSFSHWLPSVIESMFPSWMGRDLGLQFSVDARYWISGRDESEVSIMRHVLIHRPMNYTKVLVSAKTGFTEFELTGFLMGRNTEYLEKHSDHDSCWRSDGFNFLTKDYFEVASNFNIAPVSMESYIGFGICGDPKFVKIKVMEPVYQDDRKDYVKGYNVQLDPEVGGKIHLKDIHKYLPKKED